MVVNILGFGQPVCLIPSHVVIQSDGDFGCVGHDGRIYLVGGCKSQLAEHRADVWCYDPEEDKWKAKPKLPRRLRGACCAVLNLRQMKWRVVWQYLRSRSFLQPATMRFVGLYSVCIYTMYIGFHEIYIIHNIIGCGAGVVYWNWIKQTPAGA